MTNELVHEVASSLAVPMGWDGAQTDAEINHALSVLRTHHEVILT